MARLIFSNGGVWYCCIPLKSGAEQAEVLTRLRQRRYANGADLCWVRRHLGRLMVFSSKSISGSKAPRNMVFLRPLIALRVLLRALTVPGIPPHGVRYSRGWQYREPPSARMYDHLGFASRRAFQEALDALGLVEGQALEPGTAEAVRAQLIRLLFP